MVSTKLKLAMFYFNARSVEVAYWLKACNFVKKRLKHMCFPVNIAKN